MGTQLPPTKKGGWAPSPVFGPFLLWPNGWMHQDATWYAGRPHPRRHCVRWGPSSLSPKRGRSPLPIDDSFLDIPVHEWKQSESYQTAASTVCNIPCVNDIAERGVALIQTFSSTLQPRMRLKAVHVASHRAASATVSKLQSWQSTEHVKYTGYYVPAVITWSYVSRVLFWCIL